MNYKRFIAYTLPLALLVIPFVVGAQNVKDYLLVSDLPFIRDLGEKAGLSGYLTAIFRLGIGLAVVIAVFMIVFNGIQYMVSDVVGQKATAKKGIENAIWGLVLVLASVLILNTINPNIVKFELIQSLERAADSVTAPAGGGSGTTTPDGTTSQQEQAVRDYFANAGVGINNPPCASGQTKGCTNVAGLPLSTRTAIANLARSCGTTGCVVITGGSEGGHDTHGVGKPFADLRKTSSLNSYILENGTFLRDTPIGKLYQLNGHQMLDETGGEPHWHGCFHTTCKIRE